MLGCKKNFGQFCLISRPRLLFKCKKWECYRIYQNYFSAGCKGDKGKGDGKPEDAHKDLGCQNKDVEVCPPKNTSKELQVTSSKECKKVNDVPPVYDRTCLRPYVDPCPPTKPCVSSHFVPHPCKEPMLGEKYDVVFDPDCPYERRMNVGMKVKKALLLLGTLLAAYAVYANWFLRDKKEIKKVVVKKKVTCPKIQEQIKDPASSEDIPSEVPYLLVGGGPASFSAFRAIKSLDPTAKVLVITKESFYPYMRPPLSKELFFSDDRESALELKFKQWNGAQRSLYFEPEAFYIPSAGLLESENGGVAVARGWSVTKIDPAKKQVTLEDGKIIKYEKCLLAPGGTPKNLPIFERARPEIKDKITLFRGASDFIDVEDVFANCNPQSIAIIGGGFLGSELAVSLARRGENQGTKVTQIIRESGPLAKVLPNYLSSWTATKLSNEGVDVIVNSEVDNVALEDDIVKLTLGNGNTLLANHVIVAIGIEPNTNFANSCGLEIDKKRGGYIVNPQMLARTDLYVAGDSASFYDVKLCRRRREEHHDHAVVTGKVAGENMAGKASFYSQQSMFWSEMGSSVGFEAIGVVDSSLPTVAVFAKSARSEEEDDSFNKGVIFYMKNDLIVGILLWNVFNKIHVARRLLREKKRYNDLNDVAKLFSIHGSQSGSKKKT